MNKVKPQAGQVWDCNVIGGISRRVVREVIDNGAYHDGVFFECANHMGANHLLECGVFIPQTDLEWLAVNVGEWLYDDCGFVRLGGAKEYYTDDIDNEYCSQFQYYTRQKWQNMRYKLGLDEKPRISGKQWAEMLRNKQ